MKKLISFLLILSLSLLLCGSAMAAEKQAIDLKPAQGNYINLDSVQLTKQEIKPFKT